jgi:DNA-binding IclR family transcriptional regulator
VNAKGDDKRESIGEGSFMDEAAGTSAIAKHRIPVIDQMMEMLFTLERRPNGATIRELVEFLRLPRTTVYRILNTLQRHDVVRRTSEGVYRLGPRLLGLAARAIGRANDYDLAAVAASHLEQLAATTGESCKVSILDGDELLVIAVASGVRGYALTVAPGQRLPLHAGAAGKILLAHLSRDELMRRLKGTLARYTPRTFTDARRLSSELARIRRQGWAQDRGEHSPGVCAFAAPIFNRDSVIVAALSVPFVAGATAAQLEKIRLAVIATAASLGGALPTL